MKPKMAVLDKLITEKVLNLAFKKKYTSYQQVAIDLNVSENFIKQVFSFRSKFNLYHLVKLSFLLQTELTAFLPTVEELKQILSKEKDLKKIDQEVLEVIKSNEK